MTRCKAQICRFVPLGHNRTGNKVERELNEVKRVLKQVQGWQQPYYAQKSGDKNVKQEGAGADGLER